MTNELRDRIKARIRAMLLVIANDNHVKQRELLTLLVLDLAEAALGENEQP